MFELSHFYSCCQQNNVDIIPFFEMPTEGVTMRNGSDYAIFLDLGKITSTRLFRGICCHEMGHAATGSLHNVDSPYELAERSEYRANRWVAEHYLTADDFREAFKAGYTEPWQLSEYFDLPEQDVKKALSYWTERKGIIF